MNNAISTLPGDAAGTAVSRSEPSLRQVVEDLVQMEQEFGPWGFDAEESILSITTEPITLEGVYLGAFEIKLSLDQVGTQKWPPYTIVALDPQPPTGNEHITHPHVSDERLCEGDGSAPLKAALQEGRICDFFTLIHCVLTTYNPESPYVRLQHWNGESCSDCGSTMDEGSHYSCENCDETFCDDCISYCRGCDLSMCHNCLKECPSCEERSCSHCLKTCSECGEACCKSCTDEAGLCKSCQETQTQEPQEPGEQENLSESESTIQPATQSAIVQAASQPQLAAVNANDDDNGEYDPFPVPVSNVDGDSEEDPEGGDEDEPRGWLDSDGEDDEGESDPDADSDDEPDSADQSGDARGKGVDDARETETGSPLEKVA